MTNHFDRERERRRIQAATAKSVPIEFKPEHIAAIQTLAVRTGMTMSNALSILLEAALSMSRAIYFTDIMNAAFVQTDEEPKNEEAPVEVPKPDCLACGHPVHAMIVSGVPVSAVCAAEGCGCQAPLEMQAPPTQNESMQPEPGEDPEHFRARLQALARGEKQEEPS
jgi:hypothetical protein